MTRTIFIWIFGVLASGIIGALVGSRFDTGWGSDNAFWGFLAGILVFACARLWFGERKSKQD